MARRRPRSDRQPAVGRTEHGPFGARSGQAAPAGVVPRGRQRHGLGRHRPRRRRHRPLPRARDAGRDRAQGRPVAGGHPGARGRRGRLRRQRLPRGPLRGLVGLARERTRASYIWVARTLADDSAAAGDQATAVRCYLRVLELDPYDEPSHLGHRAGPPRPGSRARPAAPTSGTRPAWARSGSRPLRSRRARTRPPRHARRSRRPLEADSKAVGNPACTLRVWRRTWCGPGGTIPTATRPPTTACGVWWSTSPPGPRRRFTDADELLTFLRARPAPGGDPAT